MICGIIKYQQIGICGGSRMPKHEFGIMQTDPKPTQVFDDYEPEKYNCLSIDDALY